MEEFQDGDRILVDGESLSKDHVIISSWAELKNGWIVIDETGQTNERIKPWTSNYKPPHCPSCGKDLVCGSCDEATKTMVPKGTIYTTKGSWKEGDPVPIAKNTGRPFDWIVKIETKPSSLGLTFWAVIKGGAKFVPSPIILSDEQGQPQETSDNTTDANPVPPKENDGAQPSQCVIA